MSVNISNDRTLDRRSVLLGGSAVAAASAFGAEAPIQAVQAQQVPPTTQSKPNIVFILGDNVGYGAPACYNGGILDTPTPRMDRLAAEGMRLTNFNVENQRTPSRAALMTGPDPLRHRQGDCSRRARWAASVGDNDRRDAQRHWVPHGDIREMASRIRTGTAAHRSGLR